MTTTKLFIPAGVKIGNTFLGHCGDQSVDQGLDELTVFPSGDWAPNLTGSKQWAPDFAVESHDLDLALDLMDLNAVAHSCLLEEVYLYQRQALSHGFQTAEASAAHQAFLLNSNALLYWEQLSASQADEAAKLSLKLAATLQNGNPPLVAAGSQVIEDAAGQNAPYTLGPVKLNGSILEGVSQQAVALNLKVEKIASNGDSSPTYIGIHQIRPVLTFDTTDLDTICALDPDGSPVTALTSFWRRRRANKVAWLDSEAKHIKLYTPTVVAPNSVGTLKWKRVAGSPAKVSCEVHLHRNAPGAALLSYAKAVTIA
jgi:hypothetical protein